MLSKTGIKKEIKAGKRTGDTLMRGWFDLSRASDYCCTSKRTIETWLKQEGLRHSRVRGKRLIKRQWIDDFLEQHESSSGKRVDQIVDSVMKDLN